MTDDVTLHMTPRIPDGDYLAIEKRVAQLPGVQARPHRDGAAAELGLRFSRNRPPTRRYDDRDAQRHPQIFCGHERAIRSGRNLRDGDDPDESSSVILINETLARQHFPASIPSARETDRGTVVGVVGDVRQAALDKPTLPEIYHIVSRNAGIAGTCGYRQDLWRPGQIVAAARALSQSMPTSRCSTSRP